jgi:iron complex outermembrane recepter protein
MLIHRRQKAARSDARALGRHAAKLPRQWRSVGLVSAVVLGFTGCPAAWADNVTAITESAGLEEITVTAQRKQENLQDVPISVATFSSDSLKSLGVQDVASLNGKVPSLSISQNGPQNIFFIRGVGSPVAAPNGEQSVALYIDGVYMYAPVGNMFPVGADLDHIEVLKGPQGTLFGRNSTAGVIQFITKDPSHETGGEASVGYGNYQTFQGSFYGTTGLTDTVAANVSGYVKHMGNGYGVDLLTGTPTYETDQYYLKSKWLWTPSDKTELRATASYTRITGSVMDIQIIPGHIQVTGTPASTPPYDSTSNWPNRWEGTTYFAALQVDHDFGVAKLENIVSSRYIPISDFKLDDDAASLPVVNATVHEPSRTYTEELRLLSPSNSKFDWTAGLFYIHANTNIWPLQLSGYAINQNLAVNLYEFDDQTLWAIAPYFQGTVEILPDTKLTAGVRYNHEHIATSGTQVESPKGSVLVPASLSATDDTYSNTSWHIALDHKWTPDISNYASVSRSFKSGGYNLASTPGVAYPPFLPEQVTEYEVGLKTELLDHRLRLNGSAYYYQYINIQTQASTPGGSLTSNGPGAHYRGADMDFNFAVLSGLTVNGGLNYVVGHYGSFPCAFSYTGNPFSQPTSTIQCPQPGQQTYNNDPSLANASGKTTVYSPLWSGNVGVDYRFTAGVGTFELNANAQYQDSVFVSPLNRLQIPSYVLQNDSVTWTPNGGRYSVRAWVLNALDKEYLTFRNEGGTGDWQTFGPPRTYGLSVTMKFGTQH